MEHLRAMTIFLCKLKWVVNNLKVSFDFDGTLSRDDVEEYAKELINRGIEVWVVTSRMSEDDISKSFQPWQRPNWNRDLWETVDRIGIPRERVKFTAHVDKIEFLKDRDFVFHLDDDVYELIEIMSSADSCQPLNVDYFSWRENCEEALNKVK